MRKWMAYNYEFLDEEEIVRVTNEEFVKIRRDDLQGNIDIEISISTAEDNSAKAQELSFLLQTMGPNQDFEINKILMGQIMRLSRQPELEKQIMEFEPQQDPMAEQAKQLEMMKMQLEIELMKANIADKMARAGENEIDAEVKKAKMQTELGKASKLQSEGDRIDQDFILKDGGIDAKTKYEEDEAKFMRDRQAKIEDRESSRLHDLDKLALKEMLGSSKQATKELK